MWGDIMSGMSNQTGSYLTDEERLKQSIIDILTTPIGSRVICREYGSNLFKLIDQPANRALFPKIYAAVADALNKWEPRLKLEKIIVEEIKDGRIRLSLIGKYLITQQKVALEGLVV